MGHINIHCLRKESIMDFDHGLDHLDLASLMYSSQ